VLIVSEIPSLDVPLRVSPMYDPLTTDITILKYTTTLATRFTLLNEIRHRAFLGTLSSLKVMYFNMIAHIDLNDLPLLTTASQFPVNLHLWSGKDPHRPNFLELVILGKGLYGLNLPYLRLLKFWLGV
jgi:hypothetical protein